jgi:hypothetical protein
MIRMGIATAAAVVGAAGAMASGCSSSSGDNGDNGNGNDSGTTTDTGVNTGDGAVNGDSSTNNTDASDAADAAPPLPHAHLALVHSAIGVGPLRICFATNATNGTTGSIFPIAPLPDSVTTQPPYPYPAGDGGALAAASTPGIYPGTIGAIEDIASLENIAITPFLIDATQIAYDRSTGNTLDGGAELTCSALLDATGALDGGPLPASAVWQLPQIPTGKFLDGHTYLLALTGCPAGYTPPDPFSGVGITTGITAAGACGTGYTGAAANFAVQIAELDTTTAVPAGSIGVQFANFSSSLAGEPFPYPVGAGASEHPAASGGLLPGFLVPAAPVDAGTTDAGDVDGSAEDAAPPPPAPPTFVALAATPVAYPTSTTPAAVVPLDPTQTGLQFSVLTFPGTDDGGVAQSAFPGGDVIAFPVNGTTGIGALSNWTATVADGGAPAGFQTGLSYTFVFVGDDNYTLTPNADGPAPDGGAPYYDGRFMHVVAFPNVFTPVQVAQ